MLLQQQVADGVEVLAVRGPVTDRDADGLQAAIDRVVALQPRAIVLDLHEVSTLSEPARAVLHHLARIPSGWPRAALVLCPPPGYAGFDGVLVAPDRHAALQQIDARSRRPRTRLDVEHSLNGPAQARAAVAEAADRLGLQDVCDDVALVVSEMVTNAVRHAEPPVSLEIEAGEQDVVVAVCDGSPRRPAPRDAGDDAEGGRGMLLVDMLTTEHGVRPEPPGKTVWARLRRPAPEGDAPS